MRSFLHEIHRQPEHVRQLLAGLCTVAVVSLVTLVWFRSFQQDIYALLNPADEPQAQDQMFARESSSLFGSIIQAFKDTGAQVSGLLTNESSRSQITNTTNSSDQNSTSSPHPLPVSGDR